MRALRIVVTVLGLLVGAAAIAGAITTLTEDRDSDDFFVSDEHRFERSSFAITSEGVDVLAGAPGWLADVLTDPVDVRYGDPPMMDPASSSGSHGRFLPSEGQERNGTKLL